MNDVNGPERSILAEHHEIDARRIVLFLVWLTGLFFPVFIYLIDSMLLNEAIRSRNSILIIALIHLLALALCLGTVALSRFGVTDKIALMLLSLMAQGIVCLAIGYYDLSTHAT